MVQLYLNNRYERCENVWLTRSVPSVVYCYCEILHKMLSHDLITGKTIVSSRVPPPPPLSLAI